MQLTTTDLDRRVAHYRFYRHMSPEAWVVFNKKIDLSLLFHDYAMDGLALSESEINRALRYEPARHHCDAELLDGIRCVMAGVSFIRCFSREKGAPLTLEDVKQFHAVLTPDESQCGGRYRKTEGPMVPYLHEITRTPSISYRLRKLVETMRTVYGEMHPVRAAALIHHEFMSIWPFDQRSATAGRLLLNHVLLSNNYPPAIIHAIDRQAYYQALCSRPEAMIPVIVEAVDTTLQCAENFFNRVEERVA